MRFIAVARAPRPKGVVDLRECRSRPNCIVLFVNECSLNMIDLRLCRLRRSTRQLPSWDTKPS